MSSPLPPLRRELDIMPSPSAEQPGLLIRDPFQYSNAVIIVPPLLTQGLPLFDGQQTELDLRALLTRLTGDLNVGDLVRSFVDTMRQSGFLECEVFHEMRDRKQRAFAEAGERQAAHAGTAYPAEAEPLRAQLNQYGATPEAAAAHDGDLVALAAPHVSPEGGFKSYAAAYRRLSPAYAEKTFVVLGTSHYGEPEKFGLTRKPYVTPLGRTETDLDFIDALARAAPGSIVMEDYCHATEHSIEFQCVFLQHVVGNPGVRVVPILCGPLAESLMNGKAPEKNDQVRRFFDALAEMADTQRSDLVWILGIDLAHIGRRYGDSFPAHVGKDQMEEVRERDEARLREVCDGNAEGFVDLVKPNGDDLRWCGYSPVYTFLSSVSGVKGRVLEYEQWNIDDESVVSFTAMEFVRAEIQSSSL